jgi:hypothetical protein
MAKTIKTDDEETSDNRSFEQWISKAVEGVRGLVLTQVDGHSSTIYPPYYIGDDFVAGSAAEGRDVKLAVTYRSIVTVRTLDPKPKGF